ncbi:MAG: hypothetical protein ABMA64_11990 [Myxococcota bacterium]
MIWSSLTLARAADPPATVLDHQVWVSVDAARASIETVKWSIRVDDPAGCAAGVVAPPGLDGATDGGAQVLETLFLPPPDAAPGAVYSFEVTHRSPPGGHSGVFTPSPDVWTERASLVVESSRAVPLAVWADPSGDTVYAEPRKVSVAWTEVRPGQGVGAAWSTWADWLEAGRSVRATVDASIGDRWALGKELNQDLDGIGIAGVVERVRAAVALDPGPSRWSDAQRAHDVFLAGHGTAADRGVAMVALLRAAGFDAAPALYRPGGEAGAFPVTVPAPALFPNPLVVVRREEGPVYVDPAAEHTAVPELPASLAGAMVWIPSAPPRAGASAVPGPGEIPVRLPDDPSLDGRVTLTTSATITADGGATLTTQVIATGAAREILRDLLGPLDEAGRTEALGRLVRQGRPGADAITTKASGLEDPSAELNLTVSAHDPAAMSVTAYGMRGTMPPLLAPALAGWLPPRVAVSERLAITIPPLLEVAGAALDPSMFRTEASVVRDLSRDGQTVVSSTEVTRTNRARTPATDAAAAAFLATEATKGADVLLFAGARAIRKIRAAADVTPADRAAVEMLVWLENAEPAKAERTVRKALPAVGFDPLVTALLRFTDPADQRPWQALGTQQGLGDLRRVELCEALERAGDRSAALAEARALAGSEDPEVRVRSRLAIERLQGPPGSPGWRDPAVLLAEAGSEGSDWRIDVRQAELRLTARDGLGAAALLDPLARGPIGPWTPRVSALSAHARALTGAPADEVRAAVYAAVASAPDDAAVGIAAAEALLAIGDEGAGLDRALIAAGLAVRDPVGWSRVVPIALAAGQLTEAERAARQASDTDPENKQRAARWAELAYAKGDRAAVDAARARAGMERVTEWPPSLDLRMAVDPEAVLAVLVDDEGVVAASPRLLAIRAQLRIERGMLDEAAQDGLVLALRHQEPGGWALAFAATAGRQYWTRARDALDLAARTDPVAMTTRMEYRLISGSGDPTEDARRLPDDPRAEAVLALVKGPSPGVAATPGWPVELAPPTAPTAPGYKPNRWLSAAPGVKAASNPAAAASVVRVGGGIALTPPPFAVMYPDPAVPVSTLPAGGTVVRLSGGVMPVYAVSRAVGAETVWAFAFTPAAAARALEQVAPAP